MIEDSKKHKRLSEGILMNFPLLGEDYKELFAEDDNQLFSIFKAKKKKNGFQALLSL
ncbi:MAG: hypothetical protein PUG55_05365 [Bacillales bacterium]|nr:hypothetical protein [Bacillales bacterium]